MIIGGKEISEILVRTKENELILSITDKNFILKNGYDVDLWPSAEKKSEETEKQSDIKHKKGTTKSPHASTLRIEVY